MTELKRSTLIDAPKQKVWAALADFGNVSSMSPTISKSFLTSDQKMGIGATRHCDLTMMGGELEERIAGWKEGELLEIDIYSWKKLPMKKMQAEFKLEEKDGQTLLTSTISYIVKYGPVGKLMDLVIMRSMNINGWEAFQAGIKHFVETGETVDSSVKLDLQPVMATT